MNILAFDTSTRSASVAIIKDGILVAENIVNDRRTHSQKLMPILENMMDVASMKIDEIDVFAVCIGPGSFTGIRIGVSTVKAFSHVFNKPIVSVNSLESIASNMVFTERRVIPIIDAQANNLYMAEYDVKNGIPVEISGIEVASIDEIIDRYSDLKEEVLFIGEGTEKYYSRLSEEGFTVVSSVDSTARASSVAKIARYKYENGIDVSTFYDVVPMYIRKSQAEIQLEEKEARLSK